MIKTLFFLLSFFIAGCNANESFIDPTKYEFDTISFDVVQKKLIIETELPDHLQLLLNNWFEKKVKINGFDGDMKFIIFNFDQKESEIIDGKRVDISMSFNIILNKPTLSQSKSLRGSVSTFGTLSGEFSINDFETVIRNTQTNLVQNLSEYLKSKSI